MRFASGLLIDVACCEAVLTTEVIAADGAWRAARRAGDVVVPADSKLGRHRTTGRTRHLPLPRATQHAACDKRTVMS
jgi:hypothetical protein